MISATGKQIRCEPKFKSQVTHRENCIHLCVCVLHCIAFNGYTPRAFLFPWNEIDDIDFSFRKREEEVKKNHTQHRANTPIDPYTINHLAFVISHVYNMTYGPNNKIKYSNIYARM